jgi:4-amino-4-deoxy-L-arabinose transferase-like glycosyltransferase
MATEMPLHARTALAPFVRRRGRDSLERLALTLAAACVAWALLAGAAARHPVENREIRIFGIANGMLATGHFLVPQLRGSPRLEKPPLYHWLAVGSRWITGLPPRIAYRLPSVLAGVGLMAAVYALCRVAAAAALALPSALALPGFALLHGAAREASFDMLLASTAFCAAAAFWLWLDRGSRGWWQVGVVAFAAALLAKATPALGAVLIPVVIAALVLRPARQRPWAPALGAVVLALLPLAVWGVAALLASPESSRMVIDEALRPFGRRGDDLGATHYYNLFRYLYMVPILTLPGSLLLPAVLLRALATRGYREAPILRWALWSGLSIVGIFSLFPQKQENYMAMILPYAALLVGDAIWAVGNQLATQRCAAAARAAGATWGIGAIAAGAALWWALTHLMAIAPLEAGLAGGMVAALGALALWWAFGAAPWRSWLAGLGAFVVLAGMVNGTVLTLHAQMWSGEAGRQGDPRVQRWQALAAGHHWLKAYVPSSRREPDEL